MKIGIDCRLAGRDHAGIGRYIEELVRVVTQDTSITWVLFLYSKDQLPWLQKKDTIKIVIAPIKHYTLAEQVILPSIFLKEQLDLLHVPHFNIPLLYTKPTIVTIHDLLWHEQKGAHVTTLSPFIYAIKYWAYTFVVKQSLKRSLNIFVPSQTVKETIEKLEPTIDPKKIIVTYEGVDKKWFQTLDKKSSQRDLGKQKVLFYTGSLYPHKNVLRIATALKQLPEYVLKISSSRSVFVDTFLEQVKKIGVENQVQHLGRLSDEQLIQEYKQATAFVQPSISEGFGLPALEAMATGLPVLASNIPIFHEIYHDGFIPFDPVSVESFIDALHTLESSNLKNLQDTAQKIARRYTWDTMGQRVLQIYRSLSSHSRTHTV